MIDIAPETLATLRDVFSTCGPFESDRELSAVFVDARIAPCRDELPEADNRMDRIDALIEYLHDAFLVDSSTAQPQPQNALVLFIQVLVDRTEPEDACHPALQAALQMLADDIARQAVEPSDLVVGRVPSVASITNAALLEQLITNQQTAIRSYRGFAFGLVAVGLAVSLLGFTLPGLLIAATIKPWVGMGGIFIASLSVLQFKEMLNRQEKVSLFTTMRGRLDSLQHDPEYAVLRERVDRLIWQVIERAAVE